MEEKELFEWWVQKLTRETKNAEKKLTKWCDFESEISQGEFRKTFNRQYFTCPSVAASTFSIGIWTTYINGTPRNTSSIEISFGSYIKPNYGVSRLGRFLLEQGKNWIQIARELSTLLENIVDQAYKIQRNIIYPEVAEMEKEVEKLKTELEQAKICLKGFDNLVKYKEFQLAEKEKEIEELKCRKEELEKIVFDTGKWVTEGNSICKELHKTRFSFKSAKIERLRERLEKIFSEMTTNILHPQKPLINPREWNPREQRSYDIY